MKFFSPFGACVAAALVVLPAGGMASDWKLSASVDYDAGKYGADQRTDSIYIPVTLKNYYDFVDISVTVPWLRQSTTGLVTRVGGRPARAGRNAAAVAGAASGPGDLLFRGSCVIKTEGPRSFDLAMVGTLKLPTADKHKGLGTGEMDEGLGAEFAKKISPHLTLLANGHFTIIGNHPGTGFNNQLAFDMGFSRPVGANKVLTALYRTRSALLDGNSDPRELSFALDSPRANGYCYSGAVLLGLSDGSPAIGLSAGISRRY